MEGIRDHGRRVRERDEERTGRVRERILGTLQTKFMPPGAKRAEKAQPLQSFWSAPSDAIGLVWTGKDRTPECKLSKMLKRW
eukprot:1613318-Pyramimonas_sp.AAC.2